MALRRCESNRGNVLLRLLHIVKHDKVLLLKYVRLLEEIYISRLTMAQWRKAVLGHHGKVARVGKR